MRSHEVTESTVEALREDMMDKHEQAMGLAVRQVLKAMRAQALAELGDFGLATLVYEQVLEMSVEVEAARIAAMQAVHRLERAQASRDGSNE